MSLGQGGPLLLTCFLYDRYIRSTYSRSLVSYMMPGLVGQPSSQEPGEERLRLKGGLDPEKGLFLFLSLCRIAARRMKTELEHQNTLSHTWKDLRPVFHYVLVCRSDSNCYYCMLGYHVQYHDYHCTQFTCFALFRRCRPYFAVRLCGVRCKG